MDGSIGRSAGDKQSIWKHFPAADRTRQHLFPADVGVEALGLLHVISEPSFRFIALLMRKILTLFEPPNSSKDMDLHTAVQLVNAITKCIEGLRIKTELSALWDQCAEPEDASNPQSKRRHTETNKRLQDFIVEQSLGVRIDQDNTAKRQRLCIMDVLT